MTGTLIKLLRANKTYEGGFWALRDAELDVARGESVAIMGHSGSGKTTLLNVIGMLDRLTTGKYFFEDREVSSLSDSEISTFRSRNIGFVFQSFHLIPQLTAVENVEVPLFYLGFRRKERRKIALQALDSMGLSKRTAQLPAKLSGGERQRVAIARALAPSPDLLLADEPTGNLDSTTGEEIIKIILDLHARGKTVIVITHDSGIGAKMQRRVSIRDGRIRSDSRDPSGRTTAGGGIKGKARK